MSRVAWAKSLRVRLSVALFGLVSATASAAGFQLERYEPTPAGETFLWVASPRYAPQRFFSGGFTFDYGNSVLWGGVYNQNGTFVARQSIVSDQLLGRLDLSISPWHRLQLSLTAPLVLLERGTAALGVTPNPSVVFGDPRLGVAFRVLGDDRVDPWSLHLAAMLWVPVGAAPHHAGDATVRGHVAAIMTGQFAQRFRWAGNLGALIRPNAALSKFVALNGSGATASELQASGALHYQPLDSFSFGPELVFATGIAGAHAFQADSTHLEALISARVQVGVFQIEPGVGLGLVRSIGTPTFRGLLRVAFAPPPEPAKAPEPVAPPVAEAPAPKPVPVPVPAKPAEPVVAEPVKAEPPPEVEAPKPPPVEEAQPAKTEEPPRAFTVFFQNDSDAISNDGPLVSLGAALKQHPDWRVRLRGHSDELGDERYNHALSERRAQAAARAIMRGGAASSQIDAKGEGVERLGATTSASRPNSRRVDVVTSAGP